MHRQQIAAVAFAVIATPIAALGAIKAGAIKFRKPR